MLVSDKLAVILVATNNRCRDYFAQHYWLKKQPEGASLKKQAMRALKDEGWVHPNEK